MKKNISPKRLLNLMYWGTLLSFVIPSAYLIFRIIFSKNTVSEEVDARVKADYILMLIQCILGIIVIHLPAIISKKLKFEIPYILYFIYIIFLYCAIFLGEVRSFYYVIPFWDDILHCMSSVMTGLFGFMTAAILNRDTKTRMSLSPFFLALFAFCFSVTVGSIWEIYEFAADEFMGLNMQKFMLKDGTLLIGHEALTDTMNDIIIDCLGAFFATVTGYFSIKNKKGWIHDYLSSGKKKQQ